MTDTELYATAVEIEITACEWGEGPDHYPAWTDQVSYTADDVREAVEMAAEWEDALKGIERECWLSDLSDRDWLAVVRAIDELRRVMAGVRSGRLAPTVASILEDLAG